MFGELLDERAHSVLGHGTKKLTGPVPGCGGEGPANSLLHLFRGLLRIHSLENLAKNLEKGVDGILANRLGPVEPTESV